MVALNFPASPSNGDEFQGYVYDSTLQVWNRKPSTVAYTVSPTVPANPNDGDVWFNEQDGSSYIYYIDEDSEQWVEIGGKVGATGSSGVDGIDGVGIPAGGTTGQALSKTSGTDYDTQWVDISTSLEGLTDTNITTPVDGQALVYDDATSKWLAGDVASGPLPAKTIASDSIDIDFSDGIDLETRAVTGDVTFTASNYTSGVKKTIYLEGDIVQRSLTFPTAWNFITDKPTAIGASRKNVLDLNSFGTSESTTVAIWLGASSFESLVATGGTEFTIALDGVNYRVHSFTSVGATGFNVTDLGSSGEIEYLIVGGGAGGGETIAGGGGAGGLAFGTTAVSVLNHNILVGAGGAGGWDGLSSSPYPAGSNGTLSSAFGIEALGGGAGGGYNTAPPSGNVGSSGGMGAGTGGANSATVNLGNSGGTSGANGDGGAGGGGFGAPGGNSTTSAAGNGGAGYTSSITGTAMQYAGGGGGGARGSSAVSAGGLGAARGGNGGRSENGGNAAANSGSGGGAGGYNSGDYAGGNGGSGIVIIRYPITDPN